MQDGRRAICNGCEQTHESEQLEDLPAGYVSWIEDYNPPGFPEPVGLCPSCGEDCYWVAEYEAYKPPADAEPEGDPLVDGGTPEGGPQPAESLEDLPPVIGEDRG